VSSVISEIKDRRILDDREDIEGEASVDVTLSAMRRTQQLRSSPSTDASIFLKISYSISQLLHRHSTIRYRVLERIEQLTSSKPDSTLKKLAGLFWAISGGLLASQTLIFAKSIVKLLSSAIATGSSEGSPLSSPLTWLILIILVTAAVLQICKLFLRVVTLIHIIAVRQVT
jgi:hypothetical protein